MRLSNILMPKQGTWYSNYTILRCPLLTTSRIKTWLYLWKRSLTKIRMIQLNKANSHKMINFRIKLAKPLVRKNLFIKIWESFRSAYMLLLWRKSIKRVRLYTTLIIMTLTRRCRNQRNSKLRITRILHLSFSTSYQMTLIRL